MTYHMSFLPWHTVFLLLMSSIRVQSVHLTLLCHARTNAQRTGHFSHDDDELLPDQERLARTCQPVLCAPESRARQTAAWLSDSPGIDPLLRDVNLGRWQGLSLKQVQRDEPHALAQWLGDPDDVTHGGESIAHLCQRVAYWLQARSGVPGDCLAVTHPFVLRAALVHVLGSPLSSLHRMDVLPCASVQLTYTGQWRLRLIQKASL